MARNRSRNKPRTTLQQDLEAVHLAFAPIAYSFERFATAILDRLDRIIGPTELLSETPTTCRVGELSVDHLGRWILVSTSPHPNEANAGRLVGLRPGLARSTPTQPTRTLVLQQGAEQSAIEIPNNIIALIASRDWR